MPRLPFSPRKMFSLVGEVSSQARDSSRLLIAGSDSDAMERIRAELARDADSGAVGFLVETTQLAGDKASIPLEYLENTAVLILVASSTELASEELGEQLDQLADTGVPIVMVLTEAPGMEVSFPGAGIGPSRVVGLGPDGIPSTEVLSDAVVDAAGDAAVSLSSGLPALREATCRHLIKRTAKQNGIIGTLFIIPGADMPVMTLNEARMVLRMAAAHGESVGLERALELLGIVGSGLGLRALARQAACYMPGPGWAVKGSVAYTGTVAIGAAAKAYFDGSARVTPSKLASIANKIKKLRG